MTKYYLSKGFPEEQARFMAYKLVLRVERRQRKERIRIRYKQVNSLVIKWLLLANWKATILHSLRLRRLVWVGKSYNPDYTLACTGSTGLPHCYDNVCLDPPHNSCISSCTGGSCSCPSPSDPHSHQVSSACGNVYTGVCGCRRAGEVYACYSVGATCPCTGTCGYSCDTGYTWNGSSCVPGAVVTARGDGLHWIVAIVSFKLKWRINRAACP